MMWLVMFARSMVALLVLLAACGVGEVPGSDAAPGPNQMSFVQIMQPIVMPKCTGCHSIGQNPILQTYDTLARDPKYVAKPPETNILITKDGGTGQHPTGVPYFTAAEKTTVSMWIANLQ